MTRVVFTDTITDPLHAGVAGLSDIVWSLVGQMRTLGYEVHVAGLYRSNVTSPDPNVPVTCVVPLSRQNVVTRLLDVMRVARRVRALRPDVVHASDCLGAAAICLLGLGQKTVYHAHQNIVLNARNAPSLPWDRAGYLTMRAGTAIACRSASRVISLGPSLTDEWVKLGVSRDRILEVPNGLSTMLHPPRHPVPGRLLYVGRLSAEKAGVDNIIRALSALPEEVHLVVAGDGPLKESLVHLTSDLKMATRVRFEGYLPRSSIEHLYAEAELVVLPSLGEMMPRVMLEAWAAGAPFAATPVGAVPDYLHDSYNGFIIPSVSPSDIVGTICRAHDNPELRARVARTAREDLASYSWPRIAETIARLAYEPITTNGVSKHPETTDRGITRAGMVGGRTAHVSDEDVSGRT